MTELMQWMTKNEFMVNMAFIDKVNECFEKEKEQILASYNNGSQDMSLEEKYEPLEYYNQTYGK